MKKIQKLTPAIIKRIIAEEKRKIISKNKSVTKKIAKNSTKKVIAEIEKIKLIDFKTLKVLKEYKKLAEAKKILKKRLMRNL